MNEFLAVISALIGCAVVIGLMVILTFVEMRHQIKSYNKRHKGQYDENTSPRKMSQRYRDWYVENFANMKEGSYDENEK